MRVRGRAGVPAEPYLDVGHGSPGTVRSTSKTTRDNALARIGAGGTVQRSTRKIMDNRTFIVEIAKAAAWPTIVVFAILVFRSELGRLLARVSKLKHKETEIEFSLRAEELKKKVEATLFPTPASKAEPGDVRFARRAPLSDYDGLIRVSPRDAILAAWRDLEFSALELLPNKADAESKRALTPLRIGALLYESKLLSDSEWELYSELRNLRNQAAHDVEFSVRGPAAQAFCDSATAIRRIIKERASRNT